MNESDKEQVDWSSRWDREFTCTVLRADSTIDEHAMFLAERYEVGLDVDVFEHAENHALDFDDLRLAYLAEFGRSFPGVYGPHYERVPVLERPEYFMGRELPPELVPGRIGVGEIGLIVGGANTGKSCIVLDLLVARAAGGDWLGLPVAAGNSLYIPTEGRAGLGARLRASYRHHGLEEPCDSIHIWNGNFHVHCDLDRAIRYVKELDRDLVVLDTLGAAAIGADETTFKDWGGVVDQLVRLRDETGATVVVVHHTGKRTNSSRNERGHTVLVDRVDFAFEVRPGGVFESTKQRDRAPADAVSFRLQPCGDSVVPLLTSTSPAGTTGSVDFRQRIIGALRGLGPGRHSRSTLAKAIGGQNTKTNRDLATFADAWDPADPEVLVQVSGRLMHFSLLSPSP